MKKKLLGVLIVFILLLAAAGAGGYLFYLKPLLTLKSALSQIQNDNGSYDISWKLKEEDNQYSDAFCSLSLDRDSELYAGDLTLADSGSTYTFFYDHESGDILIELGSAMDSVLPDNVKSMADLFGITSKLEGSYISLAQLQEIVGSDDITTLLGAAIGEDGQAIYTMGTLWADLSKTLQGSQLSATPLFSTGALEKKGIDTQGYYFYQLDDDKFDGDIYIGISKTDHKKPLKLKVFIDYEDADEDDHLFAVTMSPKEPGLTVPDSVLTDDQVEELSQLVDMVKSLLGK